jgi:hypothetical protein
VTTKYDYIEAWELNKKLSEMYPFTENTAASQALKTLHEAIEFSDDPSLEEAADVMVTVFQWLIKTGFEPYALTTEVGRKTLINLKREWWRKEDGTLQHN